MIRFNVINALTEHNYGTIVNFGKGDVAMHEAVRQADAYLTFTNQEPCEINKGTSNVNYETTDEMENGADLHFVFSNLESLKALQSCVNNLTERYEQYLKED